MKIAVIGTGNVGGALARRFSEAGHSVVVGARFPLSDKSKNLAAMAPGLQFLPVKDAVSLSDVIIISVPAPKAVDISMELGDTTGKVIIDTMNIVMKNGPEGFDTTAAAILAHTASRDVVKCFNSTGFENMLNPIYHGKGIDMFMAGSSLKGKEIASQLAKDIGFGQVWDMGGDDKFQLLEQLALVWINQAIFQKGGRNIALSLISR